jgi:non-ribosomal peptide synthetase component F
LLEGIVADPDRQIASLPLLSENERQQLLEEWNGIGRQYRTDHCVHHLFEAQAERSPDALAIAFGDERVTYGELNVRANKLAHRLRAMGVGPEKRVAVCM